MRRLVTGLTNLTWITAGYGWFTLVAPILVAAPLYFAGNITFGGLMMASGAFIQVQSSLRWFVDNFSTIADWRATLLRVASFRRAVIDTDVLHDVESRIAFADGRTRQDRHRGSRNRLARGRHHARRRSTSRSRPASAC
jgi:putative ATP-binding cassette transporter